MADGEAPQKPVVAQTAQGIAACVGTCSGHRGDAAQRLWGACKENLQMLSEKRKRPRQPKGQQTPPEPAVTCVEALPSNSAVLVAAASAVPWRAHLRVVAAAATSAAHAGTMSLPSGLAFGIEQIGFQNRDHRASDHAFADVRAVTVDELVREDLGGHVPLVLTIDTEGSDALVLEGARTTLAR